MLSSIHPLGERARHNRFGVTATWHIAGALAGGAAFGLVLGLTGRLLRAAQVPLAVLLVLAEVAAAAALAIDATRWPAWLWRPHRQVDENWLQRYRGWVYGAGYGMQLGVGYATIVTAATTYAFTVALVALAAPVEAAALGAMFGFARGVLLLAARRADTPERLVALHRGLQRRAPWGRAAAVAGDLLLGAGALVALAHLGGPS